jgi:queuine tRNA-ribosyltransferase
VLDECPRFPAAEAEVESSLALSMRWAKRSKTAFGDEPGASCFGIVQGGTFAHLRERSVHELCAIGFDGYALGGLAVGEGQETMFAVVGATAPQLPAGRPRYLMGVGKPDDIVGAVMRGVDMFDCVLPTRSGRNGQAFTFAGPLNLRNARHAEDPAPLDEACSCRTCRSYSRAYLHHTVKAGEIIAAMLLTWHNLEFYQQLMRTMRTAIEGGTVIEFAETFLAAYCPSRA